MLTEKPYHAPLYPSPPLASLCIPSLPPSLPPMSPTSCYKPVRKEEAGRVQKDKIFFAVQWMKLQGRFNSPVLLFSACESCEQKQTKRRRGLCLQPCMLLQGW